MSLIHETIVKYQLIKPGDIKVANYSITFSAGVLNEPEPGWFLLNGASISNITYPKLWARFGTTFGGTGSPDFNLPDWTNQGSVGQQGPVIPIGKGVSNFTSYSVTGGEVNHSLVAPTEMPAHSHGFTGGLSANSHAHSGSAGADNGGAHGHTYPVGAFGAYALSGSAIVVHSYSTANSGSGGGSHSHTFNSLSYGSGTEGWNKSGGLSNSGSGTVHNNMMPFFVVGGYLVKHD